MMVLYKNSIAALSVLRIFLIGGLLLLQSGLASAVSTGQIDDFTDGTLQNWAMGASSITTTHMTNIADGGPAGAGDNFLQVVSDGVNAAGGRMTFFNKSQWTGDYLSAGITAISMDLNNISSSEALNLRLALNGGFLDANLNIVGGLFATSASVTLDSGSGWTHVVFSLAPGDLVPVSGRISTPGNDVLATLGNVQEFRLLNSAVPDWAGLPVIASLGIDNVTTVPLPPSLALFTSGLFSLLLARRRELRQA